MSIVRCAAAVLLAAVWIGCTTHEPVPDRPETDGAARVEADSPAVETDGGESGRALAAALDAAFERRSWNDLEIEAGCQLETAYHSVKIFGTGVGIWDGERQFNVDEDETLELLAAYHDAGFSEMRESYGGKKDPLVPEASDAPGKNAAYEVICLVALELDGAGYRVVQLARGRQSEELKGLAETLLRRGMELARDGTGAEDLGDGLEKLADGELAAETFFVQVARQTGELPGEGWNLQIVGRLAEARVLPSDAPAHILELEDAELASLARTLTSASLGELPINLWAENYTDLVVRVLDHEKNIQARQFSGLEPDAHGEKQKSFDHLFTVLEDLYHRVWNAGPGNSGGESGE